jgi:GNAT superfamily N-acetyltransferase
MTTIDGYVPPTIGRRDPARLCGTTAVGELVSLREGVQILIRPIRITDAPLLADAFDRLSDRSRWFRFLTAKRELTAAELRYFTDIDHVDHEALVALSASDGRAIGVARYIRSADDRLAADLAITVVDAWHRRGVATQLMIRLSERAIHAGVCRYAVLAAADNLAVFAMLHSLGLDLRGVHSGDGAVTGQVALPLWHLGAEDYQPLCAASSTSS